MDNITHSLLGAAMAEVALPLRSPSPVPRRLFHLVGIAAANFPDLDLVYSWITPGPLGYLLHHRGHTHTIAGLIGQAILIGLVCYALPAVRRLEPSGRRRLVWLVAAALASHVMMDATNSYGVHPLYPFSSRWFYGDAVFIFEPWLWLWLGIPVAMAATRPLVRAGLGIAVALLSIVLVIAGLVPWGAMALLFTVIALGAWSMRHAAPLARIWAGLAASTVFVALVLSLSGRADSDARRLLAATGREHMLDVIRSADPANPACWSIIGIEAVPASREYVLHPATLSLAPSLVHPTRCASHRFRGRRPQQVVDERLVTYAEVRQSLDTLHVLNARDCAVRAWLQFGRAPVVEGREILDYRFARGGENFSAMPLRPAHQGSICPPNLTSWEQPRADLLAR